MGVAARAGFFRERISLAALALPLFVKLAEIVLEVIG